MEEAYFGNPSASESPPRAADTEEVARLKAGLMQMVVTMKNMALYPDTNKTNIESVTFLHLWLSEFLSHHGPLVLEVAKDSLLTSDGTPVYVERPNDQILAAPMFRDGIQTVIFDAGLSEAELRTFLSVLLRFRNPSDADEDDLVGRLWEASLTSIRYTVSTEYEQVAPEFELTAMKVAKAGMVIRDVDAPFGEDALAPQQSQDAAPLAKPIASLFALAESSDLAGVNVNAPLGDQKSGPASQTGAETGGGQGTAMEDSRAGFEDGGSFGDGAENLDDGFAPFDDYDSGRSFGGGPGDGVSSPDGHEDGFAPMGGGANQYEAQGGRPVRGEPSENGTGEESAEDDEELDFDPNIVAEAFQGLEKPKSSKPEAPEPTSPLTLEALKSRPDARGPELAERLRQWNLNPKEVRQISALLNWDESRDISFDVMEIVNVILTAPIFETEHLPLIANFMTNEIRSSLKRLELRYLNNFIIELRQRAEAGGKFEGPLAEEIVKRLSSSELLSHLVDPGPQPERLEESYEDLRWLLYQLPPTGVNSLTRLLPKAQATPRLWDMMLEVINYEVMTAGGKTINILTQLDEKSLARLIELARATLKSLPTQTLQALTRHKAGAVREAVARALMECDLDSFHSLCAHMVLDPDTRVARLVRPTLATKRNPAVEGHLFTLLRESYTRDRHGEDLHLLDNYRLYGHTASPRAVPFLEEVLLRKDFKTFISRSVDSHKLGAALALFMMPHVEAARDVLSRAGRSSFRNVRQAYIEAERIAKGSR